MHIKLVPIGSQARLQVKKQNDVLAVNGRAFDFENLKEGSTLPAEAVACDWLFDRIERIGGDLKLVLLLPHADDAPETVRFPADIINPPNGWVHLPTGFESTDVLEQTAENGNIDWSQEITQEMKEVASREAHLATVVAETARLRTVADLAIAPLQDAVDIDEATLEEVARLKLWKKYRVSLNRLPEQTGYPNTIDWPASPA